MNKIDAIPLRISGTGTYLPGRAVFSHELDVRLSKENGWVEKTYGIRKRHFASDEETTSFMAVAAARKALSQAGIEAEELDCIIGACAVMEQPMPGTAPLVQKRLGLGDSGCAAFDVNSSCLSFLSALDIAKMYIEIGRYKNILIVSSDIASVGLDWNDADICTNFGDGAAAVVVQGGGTGSVLAARHETFSTAFESCQIRAGGTRLHPSRFKEDLAPYALFSMDGKAAFRTAAKVIGPFIDRLLSTARKQWDDIDIVIPHQASRGALEHTRRKLAIPHEKFMDIYEDHGNQVSASLPTALCEAIAAGRLRRGDTALLLGTAAGLSVCGMVLEY